MKNFLTITIILIMLHISVSTFAYELEEGFYMISAPAVYSSKGIPTWHTKLTKGKKHYILQFLGKNKEGYLTLKVSDSGKVNIVKGLVSFYEHSEKISGCGQLIADNTIKGTIKKHQYYMGMLSFFTKKSDWYLRPATKLEKKKRIVESLEFKAKKYLSWNDITTSELHTLNKRDTPAKVKFLQIAELDDWIDQELFLWMLDNNELIYDYSKGFHLVHDEQEKIPAPPITAEVEKKEHAFSQEEIKEIMKFEKEATQKQKELVEQTKKARAKAKEQLNKEKTSKNITEENQISKIWYILFALCVLLISVASIIFIRKRKEKNNMSRPQVLKTFNNER